MMNEKERELNMKKEMTGKMKRERKCEIKKQRFARLVLFFLCGNMYTLKSIGLFYLHSHRGVEK